MKAATFLLIAAIILAIIILAYAIAKEPDWSKRGFWISNFVESPWELYKHSNGAFDDAARIALTRLSRLRNPTPADNALAATIITRNILNQEHRPQVNGAGLPTQTARERARWRLQMHELAQNHFGLALDGLYQQPQNNHHPWIIDAAMQFAFNGMAELIANDPILAGILVEPIHIDRQLANEANMRHDEALRARQQIAAHSQTPAAAADAYVELATQNTDDPQNVHDTGVLASQKAIIARLREDKSPLPSLDIVAEWLRHDGPHLSEGRPVLVEKALAAVDRARAGERVVALGATDAETLIRVYARANDPKNVDKREQMRQALFDSLVDCWEDGILTPSMVCVNGRASRYLGSLVLLDWDERNWEVKKLEQFKNDIFEKARQIIADVASRAAASDDQASQKAGKLYLAKTLEESRQIGEVSDEDNKKIADVMRAEIGAMVDNHVKQLGGAIPDHMIKSVKADAQAAVI
jgi:hypothetical protein